MKFWKPTPFKILQIPVFLRKTIFGKLHLIKLESPGGSQSAKVCTKLVGSDPMIPDPNTSKEVSRYKWEAHSDTNWRCIYTTFCQEEGILLLPKYRNKNGRCIAILFKRIAVGGRLKSLEKRCSRY